MISSTKYRLRDCGRELREVLAQRYDERLWHLGNLVRPATRSFGVHCRHLYPVRVAAERRDHVIEALKAEHIGCVVNYRAVHLTQYFARGSDTLQVTSPWRRGSATRRYPYRSTRACRWSMSISWHLRLSEHLLDERRRPKHYEKGKLKILAIRPRPACGEFTHASDEFNSCYQRKASGEGHLWKTTKADLLKGGVLLPSFDRSELCV